MPRELSGQNGRESMVGLLLSISEDNLGFGHLQPLVDLSHDFATS